jgi:hypothetical protein
VTLYAPQRPLDAPARPRGRCRVCRRSYALTKAGNAWAHLARPMLLRCNGSGLPPLGQPCSRVEGGAHPGQVILSDRELLAPAHLGGTVYLLHLDAPFGHAKHYTGWASDLYGRLAHHAAGTGANLLRHVAKAGIGWQLARTWNGDRHLERRLKRGGGAARRCPICRPDLAERLVAASIG